MGWKPKSPGSVFLHHDSRVVIQSWGTTLEQRGDDDDTQFLGEIAIELSRRTRNGLSLVEHVDVFCLTEIQSVVQLLQHDELGTLVSQFLDFLSQPLAVVSHVAGVVLLYQSYLHIVLFLTSHLLLS